MKVNCFLCVMIGLFLQVGSAGCMFRLKTMIGSASHDGQRGFSAHVAYREISKRLAAGEEIFDVVRSFDSKTDNFHETPLHIAAALGKEVEVEALIKAGVDVNISSKNGWRPLHKAVLFRNIPVVKYLLRPDINTDVHATTRIGETALNILKTRGSDASSPDKETIAELLEVRMKEAGR